MSNKNVDHYFNTARSISTAMTYAQIEQLVKVKGIVKPPSKPFWWNLNFYLMILSALIIGALMIYTSNSETTPPINDLEKNMVIVPSVESDRKSQLNQLLNEKSAKLKEQTSEPLNKEKNNVSHSLTFIEDSAFEAEQELALPDTFIKEITQLEQSLKKEFPDDTAIYEKDSKSTFIADKEIILEQPLDGKTEWFDLQNSKANMTMHSWDQRNIKVIAKVKLETHDPEDKSKAIEDFELTLKENGNRLGVDSEWRDLLDCSCNISRKKGKRKTKSNEKVSISKIMIEYDVYLPNDIKLNLKNYYGSMFIPTWNNSLKLKSFKGEIEVGNAKDIHLTENYAKGKLSNFTSLELSAFKSEIEAGDGNKMSGKANYTELKFGLLEEVKLTTFKGDSYFEAIQREADVNVKYGNMTIKGQTAEGNYLGFKAEYELSKVDQAEFSASYTQLNVENVGVLEIVKSFQSKMTLNQVSHLKGELKYSPLEINLLQKSMNLNTFKGEIDIEKVNKDFELLKSTSKYTDLKFNIDQSASYNMTLESQYADMTLPEQQMQMKFREDQSQSSKIEAAVNGGNEASKIELNLFQGSLAVR